MKSIFKSHIIKSSILKNIFYYLGLVFCSIIWGIGQYPDYFYFRFFGLIPFIFIVFYRKHYIIELLIFGWIAYLVNFYWLIYTFRESGKLPVVISVMIPSLLCLYYGLQYPIIAFIYKKFCNFNKLLYYSLPVIFVTIDFIYPKLFSHSVADGQIGFLYFVQLIDITGITGLILIIMFVNLGIYNLIIKFYKNRRIFIRDFIFILPFVFAIIYGVLRLNYLDNEIKNLDSTFAVMVQGNITGKQKQIEGFRQINLDRYNGLTKNAILDYKPDFIIWPESVFPIGYNGNPELLKRILYEDYPNLIFGITYRNSAKDTTNSCLLVKQRKEYARYDKKHLLAFGEYVPFEEIFPFLRYLTPINGSFKKGDTSNIFNIDNKVRACISICFEDIFPDEIRRKINEGCNLMINITNDSWYGDTIGPVHHSVLARLRAIENRRSFYRCTATGVTTASDITGRIINKGKVWTDIVVPARLPLYTQRTIYSYIGELFSYLCIIALFLISSLYFKDYIKRVNSQLKKDKKNIHVLKRELAGRKKVIGKILNNKKILFK